MKKQDRKLIAKTLTQAKPFLWNGIDAKRYRQRTFICNAISETNATNQKMCQTIVCTRLGDGLGSDVSDYLAHVVNVPQRLLTDKNVQAFRHRWLDSLIEEFSK